MQNGTYRLRYKAATLNSIGVIVFDSGTLWACDPFHFISGSYQRDGNRITGTVSFRRHTESADHPALMPDVFDAAFEGVAGDHFGQFDLYCPHLPEAEGNATFTWLTDLNAKDPSLEALLA